MSRILLLGGTREAVALAHQLVEQGHDVTTSLAGRTREPKPVDGKRRIGGFGGADGLAAWLVEHQIEKVVDITHPFAEQISRNAVAACKSAGIPLDIRQRPQWQKRPGDDWIEVFSLAAAAAALPSRSTAFLALGSQRLQHFSYRSDVHFVVRMIDPPANALPIENCKIVLGRPNENPADEARLLKMEAITVIVSRNSGGTGSYAKIEAARNLGLPVIMIARPQSAVSDR